MKLKHRAALHYRNKADFAIRGFGKFFYNLLKDSTECLDLRVTFVNRTRENANYKVTFIVLFINRASFPGVKRLGRGCDHDLYLAPRLKE
jgi:hypothetical protein